MIKRKIGIKFKINAGEFGRIYIKRMLANEDDVDFDSGFRFGCMFCDFEEYCDVHVKKATVGIFDPSDYCTYECPGEDCRLIYLKKEKLKKRTKD